MTKAGVILRELGQWRQGAEVVYDPACGHQHGLACICGLVQAVERWDKMREMCGTLNTLEAQFPSPDSSRTQKEWCGDESTFTAQLIRDREGYDPPM